MAPRRTDASTGASPSTVVIVGAGQLGSRHLQGLAGCEVPLRIHVCEPDTEALGRAQARWHEAGGGAAPHEVAFGRTSESLPREIDLAIVATTAGVRPPVVADLAGRSTVRAWILEKVLAQGLEAMDAIQRDIGPESAAWVNTARRAMPWHQQIRSEMVRQAPLTLRLPGGPWGLASNTIHLIDLVEWWTGEQLVSVGTEGLQTAWSESKRPGNWEAYGTLEAVFSQGSRAVLTATTDGTFEALQVTGGGQAWQLNEAAGVARRSDGYEIVGRTSFQSEMTGNLATLILTEGRCVLPTLAESVEQHRLLIGGLLDHWRRYCRQSGRPDTTHLPIT